MSVTTLADTKLENAKEMIGRAIKNLSAIVVEQCDGHDDFSPAYREKMRISFGVLLDVREELDGISQ